MLASRNLQYARTLLNQKHSAVVAVRTYATDATPQGVQLDASIVKHLKPEVVSIINSKTDQLLIRKLNFVGAAVAVRLNTANKIVLQSLSQENCLRILTEELQDPWDHYWLVVRENGANPDMWLESLREVKDLPVVAHKCWVQMQRHGVFPKIEHYHQFFYTLGLTADGHLLHDQFDALKRRNIIKNKPTEETYNLVLNMWIKKGLAPFAQMAADLAQFRGFTVRPENATALQELTSQYDEEAALNYYLGNTSEEPTSISGPRATENALKDNAKSLLESYYQPSIDKLIVKE